MTSRTWNELGAAVWCGGMLLIALAEPDYLKGMGLGLRLGAATGLMAALTAALGGSDD